MSKIDKFLDALMLTFAAMDEKSHWPLRVEEVAPYFSDIEAEDVLKGLRQAEKAHLSAREIGMLFIGPSLLREILPDLIIGLKAAKVPLKDRLWCVELLLKGLKAMQAGDPFCRDGVNALQTPEETSTLLCDNEWRKCDPKTSVALHKLSSSVLSLLWGLYFYPWVNVGFEIHGPYDSSSKFGKNTVLLVRDFFDICPSELWPALSNRGYHSVKLLSVYRDVKLSIDMFDHVMHQGNLPSAMIAFCAFVDGKPLKTNEEIENLNKDMLSIGTDHSSRVSQWRREELVCKFIEIRYYCLRRLAQFCGRSWMPPSKVLSRVEEWGPIEIPPDESGLSLELLKRAFDPRDRWYPK